MTCLLIEADTPFQPQKNKTMPLVEYRPKKFPATHEDVIEKANGIIRDYGRQGYDLTLRQLYYQFVARDWFPEDRKFVEVNGKWVRHEAGTINAEPNYKWLGEILNDGRLAGRVDWSAIVDRTRNLDGGPYDQGDPGDFIRRVGRGYTLNPWVDQPVHVEVWIEKDALEGIAERACRPRRVPYFSCRGYVSQSVMWEAAQRLGEHVENGKQVAVIHLGDHDPSGIDMTRDIEARLHEFSGTESIEVRRIALTMAQIRKFRPPPNPAKVGDSRSPAYVKEYGDKSWELDALEPQMMVDLIRDTVDEYVEFGLWEDQMEEEKRRVDAIVKAAAKIKL
jgi:hypothetical protein